MKAGLALGVPLNRDAVLVLRRWLGKHPIRVYCFKGEPIAHANTAAWHKALGRASITDFRWHDLRHTWASWHVKAGSPLHVLQELGGWATPGMVHALCPPGARSIGRPCQPHRRPAVAGDGG